MQNQHIPPRAKETRALARETLKGQWPIAILVSFLAGILGGTGSTSPNLNINRSGLNLNLDLPTPPSEGIGIIGGSDFAAQLSAAFHAIWPIILPIMLSALAFSLVLIVVGPCIRWGLCRFRLGLVDGAKPNVATLFSGFSHMFLKALGLSLVLLVINLIFVAIFAVGGCVAAGFVYHAFDFTQGILASILVITFGSVVGALVAVVFMYRYSMSFYILADNPDMDIMDTLRESTRMMAGNKWRLFCLQTSFIGWTLLSLLTGGLGAIVLAPYTGQAEAVFYHHVSGRAAVRAAVEELAEFSEGL